MVKRENSEVEALEYQPPPSYVKTGMRVPRGTYIAFTRKIERMGIPSINEAMNRLILAWVKGDIEIPYGMQVMRTHGGRPPGWSLRKKREGKPQLED